MECVNRLYSYLTKVNNVKALSLENDSKILNVLYIVADDIYINDITNEIIKFCLGNNIFNLVEYKNNELVFVSNDFVNVKVCYVKELSVDITNKIVFNPYNLSISNEQLSYNTLIYSMNSIIVELGNYLIYKKAKDNIQAFNSLVKVNDSVISYLFAYYLNRCNKGILVELNDAMPKDIKLKFNNYLTMLKIDRTNECAKMILWFVDYYITNLPIVIAPKINIDYYFEIKTNLLSH